MKKRRFYPLICLLLVLAMFVSCNKNKPIKLKLKYSNPQALLFKDKKSKSSSDSETFFQIDQNGRITPVIEGVTVTKVIPFSNGAIIEIIVEDDNIRVYATYTDNTYIELEQRHGFQYLGETEQHDLVFEDGMIIRNSGKKIEYLQTTLENPSVIALSGNFILMSGSHNQISQIMNTITNKRFNIKFNGPIIALNDEKVLMSHLIMDMNNGITTPTEISWGGEHVTFNNLSAIMYLNDFQTYTYYNIGLIDEFLNIECVFNGDFNLGAYDCTYAERKNRTLFNSGDYFIVKELNAISVIKRGTLTKNEILTGLNVIKIAVKSNNVYFIAENEYGEKRVGYFSLEDNVIIYFETEDEYSDIFTI